MAQVFDHEHIHELARWSSIPLVNVLGDYNHPCQGMADTLTILEKYGALKGLKMAFVGDGNNVAVALLQVCAKWGANFTTACPEGDDLNPDVLPVVCKHTAEKGVLVRIFGAV